MHNKLMAFGAVLTLLAFPLAVRAADDNNDGRLYAYQDGLRAQIVSVLGQAMSLELACEADSACDPPDYVMSEDLMRMYRAYSLPFPKVTANNVRDG